MFDHAEPDEQELEDVTQLHHRQISTETIQRFEGYAAEMFTALGMDIDTASTREMPRRFIRALVDTPPVTKAIPNCLKCLRPNAGASRIVV